MIFRYSIEPWDRFHGYPDTVEIVGANKVSRGLTI